MKKIIVASTNPVKIAAVKNGFISMFPDETFDIEGVSVPSGVSHQPMTNNETEKGAMTRAKNARKARPNAEFWIGIEGGTSYVPAAFDAGGIEENNEEMDAFAWVVVLSQDGKVGKGRTGTFFLPPKVVSLIKQGIELGVADDMVFGEKNSKHKMGAVGLLTHGIIDRTQYYTHAVILALIRFTSHNKALFNVRV